MCSCDQAFIESNLVLPTALWHSLPNVKMDYIFTRANCYLSLRQMRQKINFLILLIYWLKFSDCQQSMHPEFFLKRVVHDSKGCEVKDRV